MASFVISVGESNDILYKKLSITSAQVLTGNSVPIDAVPAPGAGKAIAVVSGYVQYNAGDGLSVFSDFKLITQSSSFEQFNTLASLSSGSNAFMVFCPNTFQVQLVENKKLQIKLDTDPFNGTGSAIVHILYKIITL